MCRIQNKTPSDLRARRCGDREADRVDTGVQTKILVAQTSSLCNARPIIEQTERGSVETL